MRVRPVPTMVEPPVLRDGTPPPRRQAMTRRQALAAGCGLAAAAAAWAAAASAETAGELFIETAKGPRRFTVELADTPETRAKGLMFRESMPVDHGMLFDFGTEQPVAFWMRNTPLPLDMLFIDAHGVVVGIARDTTPYSEEPIPSGRPVRAVLEVNAGTAERLGIVPGARVRHPIFATGG
ncbi:DUF192 domain-containing protein [Benzoatithermus flavus]|uniref:DUF192 domain-containing protein n=1 Tax=Benzoatithermus flavus TaxID=3108223 RepID=A0ABU8XKT4_9PROT